jgi:hypothetical protein
MSVFSRRAFLGASIGGIASGLFIPGQATNRPIEFVGPLPESGPFKPDTLFLTWQRDPTTTMTIQWVGRQLDGLDPTIRYHELTKISSDAPSDTWQPKTPVVRPYPLSELKLFRTELTGLKPGADYEFRIGTSSPTYRFKTMPAKATDSIHFVSGGDCGVNSHTVANNVQAARQDPMFAVIGGDLAYEDGRVLETNLNFLRNYSRDMVGRDGRLIPMIACIGNHEVNGGYKQPRSKAPFFYALFDGLYPETGYASLDFGDYLSLVLLDTEHTSLIAGDQTDWLEKTLKARQSNPHMLVVNHVPAYPSARDPNGDKGTGAANRKHWVPLFEKYRVPVVLEHHDHTFKRTKPLLNGLAHENGVVYLGDGSWGRLRALLKPEKTPYMALTSRNYHLSLHSLQGEERFHLALDENGRVMDVTRSGQRKSLT